MSNLEKKVDALIRMALSANEAEHAGAVIELRKLVEGNGDTPTIKEKPDIDSVLLDLGVPAHLKGHRYLKRAIEMAVENRDVCNSITKELYPGIATEFHTTNSRVERAIRHAIEVGWERADLDTLVRYFGATVSPLRGKPTNGEYIARIANVLRK